MERTVGVLYCNGSENPLVFVLEDERKSIVFDELSIDLLNKKVL